MAITTILIDDLNETINVERATAEDFSTMYAKQIKPIGEKGWLVALLLQNQMRELMKLSLTELQEKHLQQMREGT